MKSFANFSDVALLKKNKLKITKNRIAVLNVLQNSFKPLNHSEIMESLDNSQHWDRVTVYRILSEFTDKKLIKTLHSNERMTYFELIKPLEEQHAHWVCEKCGKIECLKEDSYEFSIKKSDVFFINSIEILIKGNCGNCH
jgi:Fur family transcriptional regulator, ferric uptake regulator